MSIRDQDECVLFHRIEVGELELDRVDKALTIIDHLPEDDVLSADREAEITENIFNTLKFEVPTILAENLKKPEIFTEYTIGRHETTAEPIKIKQRFARLTVPFSGDSTSFEVRARSQDNNMVLRAAVHQEHISYVTLVDHKSDEQIAVELNAFLRELKRALETLRSEFKAAEVRLRDKITQGLNERRQSLLLSEQVFSKLKS